MTNKAVNSNLPNIRVSFEHLVKPNERLVIKCSSDAHEIFLKIWEMETIQLYEEFKVLYLDRKNGVIGYRNLSRGSDVGTVVNVKLIFAIAVQCNASGIIVGHNHPSGNIDPSLEDKNLTQRISRAGSLLEIKLLDHLIVVSELYYSFSDEGIL